MSEWLRYLGLCFFEDGDFCVSDYRSYFVLLCGRKSVNNNIEICPLSLTHTTPGCSGELPG